MSRQVLWAGPEDGKEVTVEPGQLQFLINLPNAPTSPGTMIDGGNLLDRPQKMIGRYQYNSMTKRFEWMGYE